MFNRRKTTVKPASTPPVRQEKAIGESPAPNPHNIVHIVTEDVPDARALRPLKPKGTFRRPRR